MIPLTVKINKPRDLRSLLLKVRADADKYNFTFEGNERYGIGAGYGFKGSYAVRSDFIEIIVHKKPPLISKARIIKELEKYCKNL